MTYGLKDGAEIKFYMSGSIHAFRSVMNATRTEFGENTGVYLSIMMVLDSVGNEVTLMIFDDGDVVLFNAKLGTSSRFSN